MGCTPSRGNSLHTAHSSPFLRGRTLLPVTQGSLGESRSDDRVSEGCGEKSTDNTTCQKNSFTPIWKSPVAETENGGASAKLAINEINILTQGKDKQTEKQDAFEKKGAKKSKRSFKGVKQNTKKEKEKRCSVEDEIDFPEPLVKAHQAAYEFLNPSITKYEELLRLLDHATETQISLQPIVTFMVLRYEEINKGLQEIVEEGEKMFKQHKDSLAWHCQKSNSSSSNPTKKLTSPIFSESQPDLLQQLLQYTIQSMWVVGNSMCGIGNTVLEEAVNYFSSISEILKEKFKTKCTFESRLMQLLYQIEAASIRKPGPEDSMLFSEDSGIGAEGELQAGSDRQCPCIENCHSTETTCSTSSFTPVNHSSYNVRLLKTMSDSTSLNSIDSSCNTTAKELKDTELLLGSASLDEGESGVGEDVNNVSNKERKNENKRRTLSNTSTQDYKHLRSLSAKHIENPQNIEMTLKLKDAISSRIQFLPCQGAGVMTEQMNSIKNSSDQWTEEGDKRSKRPQTAATRTLKKKNMVTKQCRSRSADSLNSKTEDPTLTELKKTQKELNQRLAKINKVKCEGETKQYLSKQIQQQQTQSILLIAADRQHSLNKNIFSPSNQRKTGKAKVGSEMQERKEIEKEKENVKDTDKQGSRGQVKVISIPSPPPSPQQSSGTYQGRDSVKKLIDTFSQGMEKDRQIPKSAKMLGPPKGVRKWGVPIIPGLGTSVRLAFNENNTLSGQGELQCSEITDDFDIDNLPSPPLEVLMDNSFENVQAKDNRGRFHIPKKTTMTQRLQASLQSLPVLPSKGDFHKGCLNMLSDHNSQNDARGVKNISHHDSSHETGTESQEAIFLYNQARKIFHLKHSFDSPTKQLTSKQGYNNLSLCQGEAEVTRKENSTDEAVPNTASRGQTPSTPPLSRTHILPSTSVLHRRLPSPPVFKNQPISITSSSPPVVRKLPTPPSTGRRTLSITSAMQHDHNLSLISGVAYPFKAPSPPASPKVQRWSRESSSEDSTSRVFGNAQSVFCPASSSLFEAQSVPPPKASQAWVFSGSNVPSHPWGIRGQLQVYAQEPQPFISWSQRPSLSLPPKMLVISGAEKDGSEPAIGTHGSEDGSTKENTKWNDQTELRDTVWSASHPDLCIVGQGLQRE